MANIYEYDNGELVPLSGGGSGGSGGHIIENSSGTELAQEDTLQFSGYLRATDDSTNGKTVVTDAPEEVTWAVWQTMTDQQKTGHHWHITDAPTGADSVRYFTISSSSWAANTGSDATEFPYVYTIASTAYGADFVPAEVLLLGSSSGDYPSSSEEEDIALVDKYIKFTATAIRLRATDEPTNNLTLVIRDGSSSGATGGGGHTIQDAGTDMAQEDALNFIDHDISDDSTNGATVVKPHRFSAAEMSEICSPLPDAPTVVGNVRMSKLWENPAPTSAFAAQNIELSSDDYDMLMVTGYEWKDEALKIPTVFSEKGNGMRLGFPAYGGSGVINFSRKITRTDDTHFSVDGCYRAPSSGSPYVDNEYLIPTHIYGIKLL